MISFTTRETKSHDGRRKGRIKGRKKLSFGKVGPKGEIKTSEQEQDRYRGREEKRGQGEGEERREEKVSE